MGKPDPPAPPAPVDTARGATSTNVGTAVANAMLNNTNQITPEGELRYDQTGDYDWYDPYTGLSVNIPTFTATQIRSPQQQAIMDQTNSAKYNLAGMANAQSSRLSQWLANNINVGGAPNAGDPTQISGMPDALRQFGDAGEITRSYGNDDNFAAERARIESGLFERMNPQLERERGNIEQRLADQGIRYGSQAYASAMDDYNRQSNDARLAVIGAGGEEQQRFNQMANAQASFRNQAQSQDFSQQAARGEFSNAGLAQTLAQRQASFNAQNLARQQYMNEQFAIRNQPINEISSLLSGTQISNPNFINTPNNQIPTTDVAGLINNRFSQDMDIYKQESQNYNQMIGGIFGMMGGMMRMGMGMSDEREKENAVKVGTVFAYDEEADRRKLPIYEYNYKRDPEKRRHVGPMAQDVEKINKRAVREIGGVKFVDHDTVMGSILRAA